MAGTVAVALTVLAGCGGGSGNPGKSDYLHDANTVCAVARTELLSISGDFTGDTPHEQVVAFLRDVYVPRLRQELDVVRALGFPDGDRAELEAMFADYEQVLAAIERDPDAFASSPVDPFAAVDARLDAYGLTECGAGG